MDILRLSPAAGAVYVNGDEPGDTFLFGCFSEINKWLAVRALAYPRTIVLPDRDMHRDVPQMVPEFLLYGYVFREGNFDFAAKRVKHRMRFVGDSRQLQRVWNILEVSYIGTAPHVLDMIHAAPEVAAFLGPEGDYFALKGPDGEILPLEDYVELVPWDDDGTVSLDGTTIAHVGPDAYEVRKGARSESVKLSYDGDQPPVWQIPSGSNAVPRRFGLSTLGSYDGFDPKGPSMGLLLALNEKRVLLDAGPYVNRLLEAQGVAPEQLDGLIVTHIHEDHTGGLPALAELSRRLKLWSTPEIWESVKLKLAAVMDRRVDDVALDFDFHELPVGEPFDFHGVTASVHYSCHTVPTIGLQFDLDRQRMTFTSDIAGRDYLDRMLQDGVLSKERHDLLIERVYKSGGYIIADAGESLIHGYPKDFAGLHRSRVFLLHRSVTPTESDTASVLHPMYSLSLDAGGMNYDDRKALAKVLAQWGADREWREAWEVEGVVREFPPGTIVIGEGEQETSYAYVISRGLCNVVVNGRVVARLHDGEFFGEVAFLSDQGTRSADVVAVSALRLICLSGNVFRGLLATKSGEPGAVERRLRTILRVRPTLQAAELFAGLPVSELNSLSLLAKEVVFETGRIAPDGGASAVWYVVREGEVHLPVSGEVGTIGEHGVFGPGVTWSPDSSWPESIEAVSPTIAYAVPVDAISELAAESPLLRQRIDRLGRRWN